MGIPKKNYIRPHDSICFEQEFKFIRRIPRINPLDTIVIPPIPPETMERSKTTTMEYLYSKTRPEEET